MTYRDVVNKSGMSWSNMLKETAQIEFREISSYADKVGDTLLYKQAIIASSYVCTTFQYYITIRYISFVGT